MSNLIHYAALNGTRKVANLDRMHQIPGDNETLQVRVSQHCGGLLAIRLLPNGSGTEITEEALRARLQATGATLPWERGEA